MRLTVWSNISPGVYQRNCWEYPKATYLDFRILIVLLEPKKCLLFSTEENENFIVHSKHIYAVHFEETGQRKVKQTHTHHKKNTNEKNKS